MKLFLLPLSLWLVASAAWGQSSPRVLRLQLRLTSPTQLLVNEGDTVAAGDILVDRSEDRRRLETQQQRLLLSQQALPDLPPFSASLSPLPASFATAQANLEQAEFNQAVAIRELEQEMAIATEVSELLAGERQAAVQAHSEARVAAARERVERASREIDLAAAALTDAQARENQAQLRHQAEVENQRISHEDNQTRRAIAQAQLALDLSTVARELEESGLIRAQFAGTIRSLRFIRQRDDALDVELTILGQ